MIWATQRNTVLDSAPLSAPAPLPPSAPVNTERPQLSGTPKVGQTLTCSNGTWEGSPTGFTYTWLRDGGEIAAANGPTYVVKSADQGHLISCEVTATNEGGSTSAASNFLEIPTPPPSIESQFVTDVSQQNATLNAVINPNGFLTKYMLQIDTTGNFKFDQNDSCVLHPPGVFCGQVFTPGEPQPPGLVQPPESSLPASLLSQHVSVELASIGATLQPDTTYHYRAIAASGLPFVKGPTQTFTTPPEPLVIIEVLPEPPQEDDPPAVLDPALPPTSSSAQPMNSSPPPPPRRQRPKGAERCKRKPAHRKVCLRLSGARGLSR